MAPVVLALLVPLLAPGAMAQGIRFREVADEWGVDFRHNHGGTGERYMIETTVGGLALLDYDGDGDDDIFFVDGGSLGGTAADSVRSRLYRNDDGRFVDVTEASGIDSAVYGNGAAAGDYDGDGDVDLYVTAFGANELWENLGDGTFTDATAAAGVGDPLWSSAAAFADVDRDGDLDLFVGNYVDFAFDNHVFCGEEALDVRVYCHPGAYNGLRDSFYLNRGDGTFVDRTLEAGFGERSLATLALAFGDLDNDGWPDLYLANDAHPNQLYMSRGDGSFEEQALLSGVAFGDSGNPEAGMSVDFGDADGDGNLDIFVTNFELETNVLYKNLGGAVFIDARFASNVAEASLLHLAFGSAFADFDGDSDLDLIVANGHVLDNASQLGKTAPYAQPNMVLENLGKGRFTRLEGAGLDAARVSRGLVTGDLDLDGDLDAVVNNSNDRAEVYENVSERQPGWLMVDLRSASPNTLGVGARIWVEQGEERRLDEVRTGSSYSSQNSLTQHFGLGGAASADALEVLWPSGRRLRLLAPGSGRYLLVEPRS